MLLTCEPADLRDAVTALRYARAVFQTTNGNIVGALNTLTLAQFATGDTDAAVKTARQVLALLPAASEDKDDATLRRTIEAGFAKYKPR